ncbi:Transmembrane 4 L6 family member 5%2C partial [Xyrichtys novacula]|uniref:Transmembrane 4 L6 family member 5, partial n=1 Tax=Xyrichtys novacula TaxID=13765 RepID=A0AAV1HLF5_XYRNO|nr:Transmembrane 4 L6 family member 5%2C partial [Xyrichtys novacula]
MTDGAVVQRIPLPDSQLDFPGVPYSVSVLKPGYCLSEPDGTFRADGTISLITGPRTILVDTGGPWDRDFLLQTLKDRGVDPGDVDMVVGTHGHSDHVGNLSLFAHAELIVGFDHSEGDRYRPNKLSEGQVYRVDEHVCVVPTPGHTGQDVSVQVTGTSAGVVLVAGDLFECCSDEDSWRDLSMNTVVQQQDEVETEEGPQNRPGENKVSPSFKWGLASCLGLSLLPFSDIMCTGSCSKFIAIPLYVLALVSIICNIMLFFPGFETKYAAPDLPEGSNRTDYLTEEVKYMGGLVGGGLMVLVPAIHIHLTSAEKCCANRCGMFLSIGFAALGVSGATYSLSVASLGLVNGPMCLWTNKEGQAPVWGTPFFGGEGNYLQNQTLWDWCKEPDNVVGFNVGLFSTLLVAASLELVLCLIQMVNGLFGCLCGTCSVCVPLIFPSSSDRPPGNHVRQQVLHR